MILRLSYGCGKEYALLRPSDFTVAGVHKNNIKKELQELQQLAAAGVITVEGKHITLNKNHLDWQLRARSELTCTGLTKSITKYTILSG